MREIDASTAADYLRETHRIPCNAEVRVAELAGGVSNIVLRVDVAGQQPFVVKQCRERLRVVQEWRAPLRRIWTECEAMRVVGSLSPSCVPGIHFEDRANYLFAMDCAPDGMTTWKSRLMAGEVDVGVAKKVGGLLGILHRDSTRHPALQGTLADTSLFDDLRIDPYYRAVAQVHLELKPALDNLIATMPAVQPALVLGDYSPKNILVGDDGSILILDFECAHAGDPAFDVGFCLSHLLLKLFRARGRDAEALAGSMFLRGYNAWTPKPARDELDSRAARHAAACMLARLDGKSPVEYRHELDQYSIRRMTSECLAAAAPWSTRDLLRAAHHRAARGAA